ncbi:PREDICTED: protein CASC1 [Dipodomys ordii]|uniref:Dynein axonemal intermediate chain 7 n=1 Tax=Dipodomys ordii TaxID=10020 RepID=A0A1S3FVC8_DIPOR|nr:PREDICTED: protein CASC1 [Dipodomys ordii]
MGPKAKKGPGKKKLTKAERLKLQQEEEERRLKEEEEARLRFEKEEQERLERMRIAEEKWHQLEEKDLERRNQELQELNLLEECFLEAEKLKQEVRSLSREKEREEKEGDKLTQNEKIHFFDPILFGYLDQQERKRLWTGANEVDLEIYGLLVISIAEDLEAMKNALKKKLLSDKILEAQKLLVKNTSEVPETKDILDVNLCQFSPLGGVFYLDILQLPPLCKPVKGWMMVELLRGGLQNFTYPPESVEELDPENAFPPIEITLQLPENVIFFEEPMVVRWDAEGQGWKKGGISDVYYKEEDKLLSFSLELPGPFTLVQDTHINMPYLSWEMVPLDLNRVLLTVTTAFTEFQIHVKENLCMLSSVKLKDQRPVSNLKGKWLALIPFITALKEVGLNIFPTQYSHLYVIINNKVALVEVKAYRQIALLSPAFAFSWSKWNAVCDSHKVVFKVQEQAPGGPPAADWALLLFSGQRAQRLRLTEDSDAFSEAVEEGTEFHSSLFHMVGDFASPDALDRIRGVAARHVDAVCQLLLATRLLSFS